MQIFLPREAPHTLEMPLQQVDQISDRYGLGDVIVHTKAFERLGATCEIRVKARHDDHDAVADCLVFERTAHLPAVEIRQKVVREDQVRPVSARQHETVTAALGVNEPVTEVDTDALHDQLNLLVDLDGEHKGSHDFIQL